MLLCAEIADKIALIHKKELKDKGFLSKCSESFISFFYQFISSLPSTILAYDTNEDNNITGFAFFTTDINYMSIFLRKNILRVLKYPSTYVPLAIHSFLFFFKKNIIDYNVELVQIAIDEKFKGMGIAKLLLQKAEKELFDRGFDYYYLQVHNNNDFAIKFYKKNGFVFVKEFFDKKVFKKNIDSKS